MSVSQTTSSKPFDITSLGCRDSNFATDKNNLQEVISHIGSLNTQAAIINLTKAILNVLDGNSKIIEVDSQINDKILQLIKHRHSFRGWFGGEELTTATKHILYALIQAFHAMTCGESIASSARNLLTKSSTGMTIEITKLTQSVFSTFSSAKDSYSIAYTRGVFDSADIAYTNNTTTANNKRQEIQAALESCSSNLLQQEQEMQNAGANDDTLNTLNRIRVKVSRTKTPLEALANNDYASATQYKQISTNLQKVNNVLDKINKNRAVIDFIENTKQHITSTKTNIASYWDILNNFKTCQAHEQVGEKRSNFNEATDKLFAYADNIDYCITTLETHKNEKTYSAQIQLACINLRQDLSRLQMQLLNVLLKLFKEGPLDIFHNNHHKYEELRGLFNRWVVNGNYTHNPIYSGTTSSYNVINDNSRLFLSIFGQTSIN